MNNFKYVPSAERCITVFAEAMNKNHSLEYIGRLTDEDKKSVLALVNEGEDPTPLLEIVAENNFRWHELLARMNEIFLVSEKKTWPFLTASDVERITRSIVAVPVAEIVNCYKAELNIA